MVAQQACSHCRRRAQSDILRCQAAAEADYLPPDAEQTTAEVGEESQYRLNMNWSQLPKSRLQCTVEVPAELVSRVWDEVLGELRKNYKNIPGFRAQDKVWLAGPPLPLTCQTRQLRDQGFCCHEDAIKPVSRTTELASLSSYGEHMAEPGLRPACCVGA